VAVVAVATAVVAVAAAVVAAAAVDILKKCFVIFSDEAMTAPV